MTTFECGACKRTPPVHRQAPSPHAGFATFGDRCGRAKAARKSARSYWSRMRRGGVKS